MTFVTALLSSLTFELEFSAMYIWISAGISMPAIAPVLLQSSM